ncbi:phosphatidate cytidylyltransferase [Metabacillus fastidiosus]|uniref:Phosphatidate cytidylyltransferase n=1 Tax=Metabacillus fastidiosus TaxID=1458 RepID=A0ABU6NZ25_9BACI|nr:phosphatidate cytidylyltransferase [Metabacillus fastidiosus]MEC2076947.1 phosphatidate cytidylyltransferase [Metabacillus fastidiosus]MED4401499.1 phosphatidate cytidylyltransferase [Metabacillus fastidiosus]MED4452932.1 phosphatidate cytidylyltransferase [Metabacillus fastidiosus]MED4463133.1 phosphatidate cytidylyltransferase [Metabacillus fastidiosus]MED4532484.1 phosphatidate cytidylyltransferase [Metabacillus fastidiosus]
MKQRIITGVVAAAVFLPFVMYGNLPFTIFVYVLGVIALKELLRMKKIHLLSVPGFISLLLLTILLIPSKYMTMLGDLNLSKVEIALLSLLLFLTYTVVTKNKFTFDDVGFSILSTMYIGVGFYYLIETRTEGIEYIFYALFLIWVTDSGAYFVGRSLGKRKLWPEISPNKTVEGAIGGIICAIVFAWIYRIFTDLPMTFIEMTIITALLSAFGQIGDLVESALKRHYQIKDSGTILPGHGGILDRFDSLLFVLPILHLLLLLFK